jgi:peptidoglycan hydrolase-like protein with peptidoglycan-binding domain
VAELQRILTRQGYDVGKVDGKLGLATRAGVKQAQLKLGIPADSYPTADLIARLGGSVGAAPAAAPTGAPAAAPKQKAPKRAPKAVPVPGAAQR